MQTKKITMVDGQELEVVQLRYGQIGIIKGDITTVMAPPRSPYGEIHEVDVPTAGLKAWLDGALIQNAMSDAPKEVREFLQSGTTPEQWRETFPESEMEHEL